jgi:hypothetical protein
MAGAGAKLFTSGSVLTAAQVNTFLDGSSGDGVWLRSKRGNIYEKQTIRFN